jgi:predicted amidohydrolase
VVDLVIRNGKVIDPAQGRNEKADLHADNGKIIDAAGAGEEFRHSVDATGCLVVPGLIDYHLHLAPLAEIGVGGELACFPSGVTTAVDCGSAGAGTWEGHRPAMLSSRLDVRSFLHVCSAGLATGQYHENPDPSLWDRKKIRRLFRDYPAELIGLKVRAGAEIVGSLGLFPLEEAVKFGDELGVPVMVHCSNPPSRMADLLALLRRGDTITHAFQDKGDSILDGQGKIGEAAHAARERGVIFDVANANIHFSFAVARQALAEQFYPDTISTDLTTRSLYRRPAVFNLAFVLSKYLSMGMPLEKVIACCSSVPAGILGLAGKKGTLKAGADADIAVFRLVERETEFGDRSGTIMKGRLLLKPMMTVKGGEIVYRDLEF